MQKYIFESLLSFRFKGEKYWFFLDTNTSNIKKCFDISLPNVLFNLHLY